MILIYSLIVLLGLLFLGLSAWVLVKVEKFFKIENPKFLNALVTIVFSSLVGLGIIFLVAMTRIGPAYSVLGLLGSLATFYIFLRHTYKTNFGRVVGIWFVTLLVSFLIFAVVSVVVRKYVVSPFVVSGEAMKPALTSGDYLLVNKFNKNYKKGDIVVYKVPNRPDLYFSHRISALPGEKVEIKGGIFSINGVRQTEEAVSGDIELTLSSNEYFVLGDNLPRSYDSRALGPIPRENIQGKIFK